jgi:DNA-binding response OmpR family regulator
MQADRKLAAVPVIMMSAVPESVVRVHCQGYAAFLRKPFDFEVLLKAVERVTAGP